MKKQNGLCNQSCSDERINTFDILINFVNIKIVQQERMNIYLGERKILQTK